MSNLEFYHYKVASKTQTHDINNNYEIVSSD